MSGGEIQVAVLKWRVKPEWAHQWPALIGELTALTRAEPGCLWFEWTRSVDDPNDFILVEGFESAAAHALHQQADYVQRAIPELLGKLSEPTPRFVVAYTASAEGWLHPDVAPPVG